jgi:hypothetical protein
MIWTAFSMRSVFASKLWCALYVFLTLLSSLSCSKYDYLDAKRQGLLTGKIARKLDFIGIFKVLRNAVIVRQWLNLYSDNLSLLLSA